MHDTKETKQMITIKGTRDGLALFIDDQCSFEEAYEELQEKLTQTKSDKDEPVVSVRVKLGNRYLRDEQEDKLRKLLNLQNGFIVDSFESDVIRRDDALDWLEKSEVKTISRVIRSGQVLRVTGDLLLLGDVNPGGHVMATGNVYIMGNLFGIAHAGFEGDEKSVIIASHMKPNQLRIASFISRSPDYDAEGILMGCGVVDKAEDKIVIEKLQTIARTGRKLDGFERRMLNG